MTTHREAYLTSLSNLIITYNRIGCYDEGKKLKRSLDDMRLQTSQPLIEQNDFVIPILSSHERDIESVSTDESEELFSMEGESQTVKKVPNSAIPDSTEQSSDDEEHGNLDVVAEMEVMKDKTSEDQGLCDVQEWNEYDAWIK